MCVSCYSLTQHMNRMQAREIGHQMAGLEDPSGGSHLELRLAAETAAVRLMLRMECWEEAAQAAAALFNVCLKAGFQVSAGSYLAVIDAAHQPTARLRACTSPIISSVH